MRVGQNIKTIAEAKRISIKELSRMVGIPYTTLYNMVNRNTDRFDLGLLEDIAHSLDVPIGALLESGELSLAEILGSHYSPSSNGALSTHRPSRFLASQRVMLGVTMPMTPILTPPLWMMV